MADSLPRTPERDRAVARAVLSFWPAGGSVVVNDADALWRGLASLLKQARRRHARAVRKGGTAT